jgi:hypothetical protein
MHNNFDPNFFHGNQKVLFFSIINKRFEKKLNALSPDFEINQKVFNSMICM